MKLFAGVAVLAVVLGAIAPLRAQVVTPVELSDPKAQRLQQRHLQTLMAIGTEIEAHKFPYPFYFSRVLDVDLAKMQLADQRSIRFDTYKGQTVLEITGNYYAAYSADRMDSYARLKETFVTVVMPILQAEVPHFPDDSEFSAFAIEVSHHVRQKVMGVTSEQPENVTVIIPVPVAQKLVDAKSDDQKQAAILEAQVFLNGQPYSLWLQEGAPSEEWKEKYTPLPGTKKQPAETASVAANNTPLKQSVRLRELDEEFDDAHADLHSGVAGDPSTSEPGRHRPAGKGPRQPGALLCLRAAYLHRVSPGRLLAAFLPHFARSRRREVRATSWRHWLSMSTCLISFGPCSISSRRKLTSRAVDFSSTIHLADGSRTEAVEFFFPFRMMRCFATYDCTGQQLLDSGTVVINGERSALDLQIAEGKN